MLFLKIPSDRVPKGYPPFQDGDRISWHYAFFEDLMTEKSKMLATSFLNKVESGVVGSSSLHTWFQWLLRHITHVLCFLGERSIWKWSGNDRDLVCFVEVVEQNEIPSPTREKSDIAAAKIYEFAKKARDEVGNLARNFNLNEQLNFAQQEIHAFSYACFRDYWDDQDSGLPDTKFSNGDLELTIIRRGYIQGWWALALRRLGELIRDKMQSGFLLGGSGARA